MGNNRRGEGGLSCSMPVILKGFLFDQVSSPGSRHAEHFRSHRSGGRLDAGVQSNARLCYPCSVFGS